MSGPPAPRATQALGSTRVLVVGRATGDNDALERQLHQEGYLAESVGDLA
jgi:hypothetical protein